MGKDIGRINNAKAGSKPEQTKSLTEVRRYKKGERILCYGCGKPIKVAEFGGILKVADDATAYTHTNLPCLLAFNKLTEVTDLVATDSQSQVEPLKSAQGTTDSEELRFL